MLKVNFKPLWTEATGAVANMAKNRTSDDSSRIWTVVFSELQSASTSTVHSDFVNAQNENWDSVDGADTEAAKVLATPEFICTNHQRINKAFSANVRQFTESDRARDAEQGSSYAQVCHPYAFASLRH